MREYDPGKPLISLHIPKCGGTAFMRILLEWFQRNLLLHYYNESLDHMPVKYVTVIHGKQLPQICIHGHFNKSRKFGVGDYYPNAEQFISIFRDPMEAALSGYYYRKRQIKEEGNFNFKGQLFTTFPLGDVDTYLSKTRINLLNYLPHQMNDDNFREIIDKHFVYVGILEDIEGSIKHLAKRLGKSYINVLQENESLRTQAPSEDSVNEFRVNNFRAYQIYDYVKSIYNQF